MKSCEIYCLSLPIRLKRPTNARRRLMCYSHRYLKWGN